MFSVQLSEQGKILCFLFYSVYIWHYQPKYKLGARFKNVLDFHSSNGNYVPKLILSVNYYLGNFFSVEVYLS